MRKAIVRIADGRVLNVVAYDASSEAGGWKPPAGTTLVDATRDAEIGGTWTERDGFARAPEPPPPPPDPLAEALDRVNALEAALIEKGAITKDEIDAKAASRGAT